MYLNEKEADDLLDALAEARGGALSRDDMATYNHICHLYWKVVSYKERQAKNKGSNMDGFVSFLRGKEV